MTPCSGEFSTRASRRRRARVPFSVKDAMRVGHPLSLPPQYPPTPTFSFPNRWRRARGPSVSNTKRAGCPRSRLKLSKQTDLVVLDDLFGECDSEPPGARGGTLGEDCDEGRGPSPSHTVSKALALRRLANLFFRRHGAAGGMRDLPRRDLRRGGGPLPLLPNSNEGGPLDGVNSREGGAAGGARAVY